MAGCAVSWLPPQRFTHDRSGNHTLFIIFVGINGTTIPRCCGHRRSSSLPVPPANEETKSRKGKENGDNQNGKEHEGMNIYRKAGTEKSDFEFLSIWNQIFLSWKKAFFKTEEKIDMNLNLPVQPWFTLCYSLVIFLFTFLGSDSVDLNGLVETFNQVMQYKIICLGIMAFIRKRCMYFGLLDGNKFRRNVFTEIFRKGDYWCLVCNKYWRWSIQAIISGL